MIKVGNSRDLSQRSVTAPVGASNVAHNLLQRDMDITVLQRTDDTIVCIQTAQMAIHNSVIRNPDNTRKRIIPTKIEEACILSLNFFHQHSCRYSEYADKPRLSIPHQQEKISPSTTVDPPGYWSRVAMQSDFGNVSLRCPGQR